MNQLTISIIGSGNVASHLGLAFKNSGILIRQLYARNQVKGKLLSQKLGAQYIEDIHALDDHSDIYFFMVSDHAVLKLLQEGSWQNKRLVHSAGSLDIEVFKPFSERYGVMYPLQSFSESRMLEYSEIPVFIEASSPNDLNVIQQAASSFTKNIYELNSHQRTILHLSAVFISNFSNHLFSITKKLNEEEQLDYEWFKPLIQETMQKILTSDPITGQTGPARRNDTECIEKHTRMLEYHPDWQKIYTFVSRSITNMYHQNSTEK